MVLRAGSSGSFQMRCGFVSEVLAGERGSFPRKWDAYHIVDNPDSFSYRTCLESHVVHAADQIMDSDVSSGELVEV